MDQGSGRSSIKDQTSLRGRALLRHSLGADPDPSLDALAMRRFSLVFASMKMSSSESSADDDLVWPGALRAEMLLAATRSHSVFARV